MRSEKIRMANWTEIYTVNWTRYPQQVRCRQLEQMIKELTIFSQMDNKQN